MDVRALLFDVNGTLIDIETDEWMAECYRAIAHYLTYQGIALHRGEVRDLYFQIMKEQFAASSEKYPEFDVVAVWREALRRCGSDVTRSLPPRSSSANAAVPGADAARDFPQKAGGISANPGNSGAIKNALSPGGGLRRAKRLRPARAARRRPGRAISNPSSSRAIIGFRKPDLRLFQAALAALQVRPEQAVFVGNDRYRDVLGARQAGMKTILFCPNGATGGSPDTEPDYLLYHYADLPRAVDFFAAQ